MTYRKFAGPAKLAVRPATALLADYLVDFVVVVVTGAFGAATLAAGGFVAAGAEAGAGFVCAMALVAANAIATESETSIIVVFMKRSSWLEG
jgi:hypothetical protein